jgi:hypothetical protein
MDLIGGSTAGLIVIEPLPIAGREKEGGITAGLIVIEPLPMIL